MRPRPLPIALVIGILALGSALLLAPPLIHDHGSRGALTLASP